MASDLFEIEPAPRERSGWGGCLAGCLIGFALSLLLMVLAGWWAVSNWKSWLVVGGTQALEASIDASELPDQEKMELIAELKRLRDGFGEGNISDNQMIQVAEALFQSPLMRLIVVTAVETHYVVNSGLDDEEKANAKVTLQRFASGIMSKRIGQDDLDAVLSHIADRDAEGSLVIRQSVTDEDLRAFLAAATEKADAAEIPAEIEPIDPSDELKRIIDSAILGP